MNEFGSSGYLNFNTILQRLKNKKYGPGKQNVKHDLLLADVRKIFTICEKYYTYDPVSIRVCRTLETYFENEVKKMEKTDNYKMETNSQPSRNQDKKKTGVRQGFKNDDDSDYDKNENSSYSYKKIKKDKKKDKKKVKKKNKDRRNGRDSDDGNEQNSIDNVNAVDLNEEIEKGEAYGPNSGNLVQK